MFETFGIKIIILEYDSYRKPSSFNNREKSNEYKIKIKVSVVRFSVYVQQVETQNEYQTNKTY